MNINGYEITVDKLYNIIKRDRQYWGDGGGITLTGGEPFLQAEFAGGLLKRCYEAFIHTAAETCGNVPWENYEKSLPYLEWIFFDLKTSTTAPSRSFSQAVTDRILENARRIAAVFPGRLVFRLPVVPGFNDTEANLTATAQFILSTGRKEINILPLHHLGREKYNMVGKTYPMAGTGTPTKASLNHIAAIFSSMGIECYLESDTPF